MERKRRQIPLIERWESDIKAYEKNVEVKTASSQCTKCKNVIKADALHCCIYKDEQKPEYVLFCEKECSSFESIDNLQIENLSDEESKLYGGILGFCIGDMLGVPVEFSTRKERLIDEVKELRAYGTYHQPFGTWSDDTSMTLCLIDAINTGFTLQKLADNFLKYCYEGAFTPYNEVFDIGTSTKNAIQNIKNGMNLAECGGVKESDNGNGSLMRVLPLAYIGAFTEKKDLKKITESVSSLTHAHSRAKLACIIYVIFAYELILGNEKMKALDNMVQYIKDKCKEDYLNEFPYFKNILDKSIITCNEINIKSTGYVVDTLEAVFWLFFNFNSYQSIVLKAVNLGGDTDTIAAIAGGIAGIYYGFRSIPDRWVQNIEKKQEIYDMITKFYHVVKEHYFSHDIV